MDDQTVTLLLHMLIYPAFQGLITLLDKVAPAFFERSDLIAPHNELLILRAIKALRYFSLVRGNK